MPRFYFNIYDGVSLPDNTGTELAGWDEARIEAIRLAGEVLKDQAKQISLGEEWRLEVTDRSGLVLFRLDFTVIEAPAVRHVWANDHRGGTAE